MGQKINPNGLRVGVFYKNQVIRDWDAKWYSDKRDFADLLVQDLKIRKYLENELANAAFDRIKIERTSKEMVITITCAWPGQILGEKNERVNALVYGVKAFTNLDVKIELVKINRPETVAKLVAEKIAKDIENRGSFRRAQKFAIRNAMKAGVKGIKTEVKGRLNGADMARKEGYSEGRIPMSTLRADLDYAHAESDTTFGKIGVKVWIYKGDKLPEGGK